jgi:uroporphyrinogen decarboxylase
MMTGTMTPMQRTLATMGFKEPDRVPWFLLCTMHGARELGLPIETYFSQAEHVAKGQVLLQKKYNNDCYYAFFSAAAEAEAWGGTIIYREDGPPNAGPPVIRTPEDIERIEVPVIEECPGLQKTLRLIELLKPSAGSDIPIISLVVSPFSLPVMQMGFEAYLDLIYTQSDLFSVLMKKNTEFCIAWANALFEAGAAALGYFDPLASPDMIPPDLFRKTGLPVAKKVVPKVKGPLAAHLASGRTLPVIGDLAGAGFVGVEISTYDDLPAVKVACRGKLTMMGNLNGISMRHWTPAEAEKTVKEVILQAGRGGGFILSDNHGEIPWQVPDSVLMAISRAVKKYRTYPLDL